MEIAEASPRLPEEMWVEIFSNLEPKDVANISLVSSWFSRMAKEERIWSRWAKKYIGHDADTIKNPDESWHRFVIRYQGLIKHVLNMNSWTQENIKAAVCDQKYPKWERRLLEIVENNTIKIVKPLIGNANDFAAALLAFYLYYFHIAWSSINNSSFNAVQHASWRAREDLPKNEDLKVALDEGWGVANHVVWKAALPWAGAIKVLINVWYTAHDAIETPLTLYVSKTKDSAIICKTIGRLNSLYVLAYISQLDYIKRYVIPGYKAAKNKLDADNNFFMMTGDICAIWAQHTWEKPELAQNCYIQTFRSIAEKLARQVKQPCQYSKNKKVS